jgi:hypothetical protein
METQANKAPERPERTPKLLHQVRNLMRLQHYSIHTERSYVDWIRRFIHFHQMRTRKASPGRLDQRV